MIRPGFFRLVIGLILLLVGSFQCVYSQDIDGDMVYSVNLMANPAYSGSRGEGVLNLAYRDYFPGNNLNLASIYFSYDSYFEPVQGGLGFYLIENKLGDVLNDLRTGAAYSYHLRAGNDLYINAGFMASVIYRSLNREGMIFPDQIDPILGPVLGTDEILDFRSRLIFDVGVGFLINYRNYNYGIAVSHVGKPDLTGKNEEEGRLRRRLTVHGDAAFETGLKDFIVRPLIFANLQGQFLYGAVGSSFEINPLTISMLIHLDSDKGAYALQPGFSLESGRFRISYNYYFNAFKVEAGIPRTHSNLVSVSLSLNNVDNSGVMKAINYPKL